MFCRAEEEKKKKEAEREEETVSQPGGGRGGEVELLRTHRIYLQNGLPSIPHSPGVYTPPCHPRHRTGSRLLPLLFAACTRERSSSRRRKVTRQSSGLHDIFAHGSYEVDLSVNSTTRRKKELCRRSGGRRKSKSRKPAASLCFRKRRRTAKETIGERQGN